MLAKSGLKCLSVLVAGGLVLGAGVAMASQAETRDQWGLTETDWRVLDGPTLRGRARAVDREEEILTEAGRGNAKALILAGGAISDGLWGAPPDPKSGLPYLVRAGSTNLPLALARLCNARMSSLLDDHTQELGRADCKALSDAGNPIAKTAIGLELSQSKDPEIASRGWAMVAAAGDEGVPLARGLFAFHLWSSGQKKVAIANWLQAAQQGERYSLWLIGIFYRDGTEGFPKDTATAEDYFRKSAELFYPDAIYELATVLTESDPEGSSAWAKIGAERGDLRMMKMWSARLRNGTGVAQDGYAAIEWYQKILPQDPKYGGMLAGDMLANGVDGVAKDVKTAKQFYAIAATNGSSDSAVRLAQIAVDERDEEALFKWTKMASDAGNPVGVKLYAHLRNFKAQEAAEEAARTAPGQGYVDSSARRQANGGPSAREIVSLTTATRAKYFSQSTTSRPGELVASTMFGEAYRIYRSVDNVSCAKMNSLTFRCSYRQSSKFAKGEGGGFMSAVSQLSAGFMNAAGGDSSATWSDVFVKTKSGGWSSATIDAKMKREAADQSRSAQGQSWRDTDGAQAAEIYSFIREVGGNAKMLQLSSKGLSAAVAIPKAGVYVADCSSFNLP